MGTSETAEYATTDTTTYVKALLPGILGLAIAKVCTNFGNYGGFRQTDLGALSEESILATLVLMALAVLVFTRRGFHLSRRNATRFVLFCIIADAAFLVAQGMVELAGVTDPVLNLCVMAGTALFSTLTMFYWLRRIKGVASSLAIHYTFGALAISEVLVWLISFLPQAFSLFVCVALSVAQLACLKASLGNHLNSLNIRRGNVTYVAVNARLVDDNRILISNALGIGLFGLVVGFLRGYPEGLPIAFTPLTRACYAALTVAICGVIIYRSTRGGRFGMSIGIWVILQLGACAALIVFAAFPGDYSLGGVFASTVNALLVALMWYLIVAFESHGWRDPYYYALSGWIVGFGCRSLARLACFYIGAISGGSLIVAAIVCTILVLSSQVVYARYLYGILENKAASAGSGVPDSRFRPNGRRETRAASAPRSAGASSSAAGRSAYAGMPFESDAVDERNLEEWLHDSIDGKALDWVKSDDASEPDASQEGATGSPLIADSRYARKIMAELERERALSEEPIAGSAAADDEALAEAYDAAPEVDTMPVHPDPLERIMGLNEHNPYDAYPAPEDTTHDRLHDGIRRMGEHFLLSDREMEVLELYAQGHTQKRVAEELFISQGTAHTHIKRIYAKTGLHSRQDILDYLDEYREQ